MYSYFDKNVLHSKSSRRSFLSFLRKSFLGIFIIMLGNAAGEYLEIAINIEIVEDIKLH